MAPKDDEEKYGFFSMLFDSQNMKKIYKSGGFIAVFVFLVVGGIIAWVSMKGAAHKLVGGDNNYTQLSANSASYSGGVKPSKVGSFFASEEELAKADPELKKSLLDEEAGPSGSEAGGDISASGDGLPGGGVSGRASVASVSGGGSFSSGQAPKLSVSGNSMLSQLGGGQTSKVTASFDTQEGKRASVVPVSGEDIAAVPAGKGLGRSVMGALKGAFRSNVHGVRASSQDSARSWLARVFDGSPEATSSVQYEAKAAAELDKSNPHGVPGLLKDQDINATSAKSLKVPEVSKPVYDKDATQQALEDDKNYQDEVAKTMADGVMNPMFSGMTSGLSDSMSKSDAGPGAGNVDDAAEPPVTAPKTADPASPRILEQLDPGAAKMVSQGDGLSLVIDEDGNFRGCTTDKGYCLLPGGKMPNSDVSCPVSLGDGPKISI